MIGLIALERCAGVAAVIVVVVCGQGAQSERGQEPLPDGIEHDFELGVIIYQKEFADKMAAPAGSRNYGRLSVSVQARAEVELLDVVPKECFAPIPKVDSRIVRLRPKGKGVQLPALFDGAVRALFQHRQKSVKNALKDSFHEIAKDVPKDVPAEEVKRIAGEFDSERKVYQLSVSEVIEVAKMIEELI